MEGKHTPEQGAEYEKLLRLLRRIKNLQKKLPGLHGAAKATTEQKITELEKEGCNLAAQNLNNPLFAD